MLTYGAVSKRGKHSSETNTWTPCLHCCCKIIKVYSNCWFNLVVHFVQFQSEALFKGLMHHLFDTIFLQICQHTNLHIWYPLNTMLIRSSFSCSKDRNGKTYVIPVRCMEFQAGSQGWTSNSIPALSFPSLTSTPSEKQIDTQDFNQDRAFRIVWIVFVCVLVCLCVCVWALFCDARCVYVVCTC